MAAISSKFRRALVLAVAATMCLIAFGPAAHADELSDSDALERAIALAEPSIVRITADWHVEVQDDFGTWWDYDQTWSCSGFIVSEDGYIVTAGHCLDNSRESGVGYEAISAVANELWSDKSYRDYYKSYGFTSVDDLIAHGVTNWTVDGGTKNTDPEPTVTVYQAASVDGLKSGQQWTARIIEVNPFTEGDVALLKVEAENLPALEIADGSEVDAGETVLSIGFPANRDYATDPSLSPTFKDGTVSDDSATRENGKLPAYEISAPLSGGMSGGPTINLNGEVIGVNSYGSSGEDFNWLSPESLINEMLARNNVANELSDTDRLYRAGLDAFFSGDYRTAVEKFEAVLDVRPSHQQAQELRAEAAEKAKSQPAPKPKDDQSSDFPFVAVGAAALLALGGGAAMVLSRRRKSDPVAPAPEPVRTIVLPEAAPVQQTARFVPPPPPAATNGNGQVEQTAPVATLVAAETFCTECGTRRHGEAKFCGHCGHEF
jgi:serine protease Do